jgi:hypothetical protein
VDNGLYEQTHWSTGRFARAELAHLFELEDGRIAQYTHTLTASEAIGFTQVG